MQQSEILELLRPIIIAKVLKIEKHPNADRLLLVEIDLGKLDENLRKNETKLVLREDGHYIKTIVTGAGNFQIGDFVPYLGPLNIIPG